MYLSKKTSPRQQRQQLIMAHRENRISVKIVPDNVIQEDVK